MDFDLWWLLAIPLVFGLGWVAARLDARQLLTEQASLPREVCLPRQAGREGERRQHKSPWPHSG